MDYNFLKKLQIKPNFKVNVLNAPENFETIIGDVPAEISIAHQLTANFDALLIFAVTKAQLVNILENYAKEINDRIICWVFYPKAKTKLASDLNLMQSWEDLKSFNLTPCASAAVDQIWTGIRIKLLGATKKTGRANEDIKKNEYAAYIDVDKKQVTLPDDLNKLLLANPRLLHFFNQLSYTNKKEYVIWVVSAKQEKTRLDRISKTIAKLSQGKKNPVEK